MTWLSVTDHISSVFYDRARGRISVNDWSPHWWTTLTVDDVTLDNYHYLIDKHITPRFGTIALGDLHPSDLNQWPADLHAKHHLATHDHPMVFPNEVGGYLWRHTWLTRTFNPAVDGNLHITAQIAARPGWAPARH